MSERNDRNKSKKLRENKNLQWAVVAVFAVASVFYLANLAGVNFADISKNLNVFSNEESEIVITIENGQKSMFHAIEDEYMYITKDGVKYYDKNGSQTWSSTYTLNSISFVADGENVVIYEVQGKNLKLYNPEGEVYSKQTTGNILQVAVNKNGSMAVVVKESDKYKIQVYNNMGDLIMERIDQEEGVYPLGIEISEDEKSAVVSYVDITDVRMSGKILFFNTAKEDAKNSVSGDFYASVIKDEMLIPIIKENSFGNYLLIADSAIICLDELGAELWSIELTNEIDMISFGDDKYTVVAYGDEMSGKDGFDNGTVVIYDENGVAKGEISVGGPVTYLESYVEGTVIGSGKDFIYAEHNGDVNWTHVATQDIKDIIELGTGNKFLYVTNSSAQVKTMKN